VSTKLAEQVLGALHELLRGLEQADSAHIRELAQKQPEHLYEGLLTVLMRLVFILYAEDRDLLPSRTDPHSRQVYGKSYAVRGLYATLVSDAALNPDTMDERRGGWGRLLALFRLIYQGHHSGFIQARGGKLFDPEEFLFLEGRTTEADSPRVLPISDGCLLRLLESLMTLKLRGETRENLSYRTLDVEQIGSVYEAIMGFTVQQAQGPTIAIKAGKNNRTPVFLNLEALLKKKGKDRIKDIKESTGRQLTGAQANPVESVTTVDALAAALSGIVDERASPRSRIAPPATPILQPTDERRRSGSYYTPRSLTRPIVEHALEPAFERMGESPTPEQILDLKVCDPAMGSGAFLVEACRYLGDRLVKSWETTKTRQKIPPDEDEQLHARRRVAQRCLYGVDKNPRAVDLARLSLWLVTLARDHEFTFLDHALKCGDSLVGLTRKQIEAKHWKEDWDVGMDLPLLTDAMGDPLEAALRDRNTIREAGDDEHLSVQEARHRKVEEELRAYRLMGDAVIEAFFSGDNPRAREAARQKLERPKDPQQVVQGAAARLRGGEHPLLPFHWEVEFPEVFARKESGFDAIVGNPPFAGKNTISSGHPVSYLPWLQTLHPGSHGNADLVAHFFRRAFGLLRNDGVFGLIATNTIRQGDSRETGLAYILGNGGAIVRATRRLKWPGEAAVVVSVVHVMKGSMPVAFLEGRCVQRISAFLVEGSLDKSPAVLEANSGKAFQGSIVLGVGFTFDDATAAKGEAESIASMESLIKKDKRNMERIVPYIGGEEVNNDPRHAHHRYVIDFEDFPLRRDARLQSWSEMEDGERRESLREGVVPADYPGAVAADWPDLLRIVEERVKPQRMKDKRPTYRNYWWRFAERRSQLRGAVSSRELSRVFGTGSGAATYHVFAALPLGFVYSNKLIIFAMSSWSAFALLQARVHELWSARFGATRGAADDLTYNPTDVFRTFPFPTGFNSSSSLELAGDAYYRYRACLMVKRSEGLTKTYNRFHARSERDSDIERLRVLHAEMDAAVLHAYGWDDLARKASPDLIEQEADEGNTPKTRLDWPSEFKDEVLGRLLDLNARRAAEERAHGLTASAEAVEEVDIEAKDD
jgi:hypothetical protein